MDNNLRQIVVNYQNFFGKENDYQIRFDIVWSYVPILNVKNLHGINSDSIDVGDAKVAYIKEIHVRGFKTFGRSTAWYRLSETEVHTFRKYLPMLCYEELSVYGGVPHNYKKSNPQIDSDYHLEFPVYQKDIECMVNKIMLMQNIKFE